MTYHRRVPDGIGGYRPETALDRREVCDKCGRRGYYTRPVCMSNGETWEWCPSCIADHADDASAEHLTERMRGL